MANLDGISKTDIRQKNKSELVDLLLEMKDAPAPEPVQAPSENEDRIADLERKLEQVTAALLASRANMNSAAEEDPHFDLVNLIGANFVVKVQDRHGHERSFRLRGRGDKHPVTAEEFDYLRDKNPDLFEKGYLSAPDLMEENPNVIHDIASLAELPMDEISDRIMAITERSILFQIFNWVENQRFVSTDENGRPLLDEEGAPRLEELDLSPNLIALENAVRRRMATIARINTSPDGAE